MAENVDVNVVQKETNEEAKTKEVNKLHITFNSVVNNASTYFSTFE